MIHRAPVIVARLGREHARILSRIAGGRRLLVPDTLRDADRLTRLLGRDLAVLVVLHFGGERIYVPRLDVGTVVDVAKVAALTRKGLSLSEIATRLNCSERTVSRKRKQGGLMGRRARRSSAGKA